MRLLQRAWNEAWSGKNTYYIAAGDHFYINNLIKNNPNMFPEEDLDFYSYSNRNFEYTFQNGKLSIINLNKLRNFHPDDCCCIFLDHYIIEEYWERIPSIFLENLEIF